jgi:two-component system, cell cycle sensor histidine kinase and response regulator CckA
MENFKKIKLLIIESNSVDAEALMDIFGDCNDIAIYGAYELEAQWVKNIEDAQERLKEFQFDMIFQDLDLSEHHGCKSLKIIKSIAPNVPIIVTTGYINRKLWQEAFLEGAQDFILKTSVNSQLIIKTIFYTFERLKYQNLHEVR